MHRIVVTCLAGLVFGIGTAAAQLSPEMQDWASGPVSVLLNESETAAFAALASDAEAERFVELFWARRDPDLSTRANELKIDFEARVAAADKQFAEEDVRGALTDRGKVLILLGLPAERSQGNIGDYLERFYGVDAPDAFGGVTMRTRVRGTQIDPTLGVADVWMYTNEQLGETAELPKRMDSFVIAFIDPKGLGHYGIDKQHEHARWGTRAMAAAPAMYLAHPELDEPPVYPLIPGLPAASDAELAWLGDGGSSMPEGATAVLTTGVRTENNLLSWLFVLLPNEVPAADRCVGRVVLADGSVDGSFSADLEASESARGRVYELAAPVLENGSTLELALAAGDQPVATWTGGLESPEVEPGATWISPMYAGAEIRELEAFDAGTPFVFGGYHLVLRPDGTYDHAENLNYFCLVVRPGADDEGKVNARVQLKLYQDGTQISSSPARSVALQPVAPNVFMFGSQLPLSALPADGEFLLKVKLTEKVSGVSRSSEIPIRLGAAASGEATDGSAS